MDARNKEFVGLMRAAGWTQAETARRLDLTAGAVSQFVNGRVAPRRSTLRLMRVLAGSGRRRVGGAGGLAAARLPAWASGLVSELAALPEGDRRALVSAVRRVARRWARTGLGA